MNRQELAELVSRAVGFGRSAAGALSNPPVPRPLDWLVVKRCDSRLGDAYDHWWIELDDTESYGWWPHQRPVRLWEMLTGTKGTINGDGSKGRRPRWQDPHHGDTADHAFHPTLVVRKSDWQVRREIRAFARNFHGGWRWSVKRPSANCRSFQLALFQTVGLQESPHDLFSRGRGCPFLRPLRAWRCKAAHFRHRRPVTHRLGGACGCPPLQIPPLPEAPSEPHRPHAGQER
jgi:hypothetical protein